MSPHRQVLSFEKNECLIVTKMKEERKEQVYAHMREKKEIF
jgi:hypothetical protein